MLSVQLAPVLLTLADLSHVIIKAKVSEADVPSVRIGHPVTFSAMGLDRVYEGKVDGINPIPEKIGGALFYNVSVEVVNSDRALLSDMTVAVQIETGMVRNAVAVPMRALGMRSTYGTYGVEVLLADGSVETRQVRVGLNDGSKVQIVEGVAVGERVVVGAAEKPEPASPRKI